ncbi:hypothetical protein HCN51_13325 [Nonomuraea sp. FMUSA5-5]|uniref:Uncharacterized protein n=1 Tax=Nonomuraea composti TaxID=2720023 RepID=A0ABX1B0Q2_9ACTN|nr:hypothetical protein [Nonomuraea sp. FMUSA5-5]NJP90422.1 hypothetical protein [Nonomuraea sp. FMUSA5-5]
MSNPRRSREGDWLAKRLNVPIAAFLAIPALLFPTLGFLIGAIAILIYGMRVGRQEEELSVQPLAHRLRLNAEDVGAATYLLAPFRFLRWLYESIASLGFAMAMGLLYLGIGALIIAVVTGGFALALYGLTQVWPAMLYDLGSIRRAQSEWILHLWGRLAGYGFLAAGSAAVLPLKADAYTNVRESTAVLGWLIAPLTAMVLLFVTPIISFMPVDVTSSHRDGAPDATINPDRTRVDRQPSHGSSGQKPSRPEVTHLPPDAAAWANVIGMEDVCRKLGREVGAYAWIPGQVSDSDYSDRKLYGKNIAYQWSCTKNGPKLTREDLTIGCQIWYPGTQAYTTDPDYAYSWRCI